jgi:hypothetical protein
VKLIVRSSPSYNFGDGFGMTAFFIAVDQQNKESGSLMAILYPGYRMVSGPEGTLIRSRHSSAFVVPFTPEYDYTYLADPRP